MYQGIYCQIEELKRFFGEMSVPALIDMFMRNTCCAVRDRYKELKQQDLTWEQFLTEVTIINHEEAHWDSLKRKEDDKGRQLTNSINNDKSVSKPARNSHTVLFN